MPEKQLTFKQFRQLSKEGLPELAVAKMVFPALSHDKINAAKMSGCDQALKTEIDRQLQCLERNGSIELMRDQALLPRPWLHKLINLLARSPRQA